MKRSTIIVGVLAVVAACAAAFAINSNSGTSQEGAVGGAAQVANDSAQPAAQAGMLNVVVDVDRPPATINVMRGGTITLVKQSRGAIQSVQVTHYATDGRGELFIKMPGGPGGTVTTLRPTRSGQGVIQVRQPPAPAARSFYTITVFVH